MIQQDFTECDVASDPREIVALLPFWAEAARRRVLDLQDVDREHARRDLHEGSADRWDGSSPRVCAPCAHGAMGTLRTRESTRTVDGCPLCGRVSYLRDVADWEGLPPALIETATVAKGEPGGAPEPAPDADPAVAEYLALIRAFIDVTRVELAAQAALDVQERVAA